MEKRIVKNKEELYNIIDTCSEDADLNHLDLSLIDDLSFLFMYSNFNGDISKWDVSHVKNTFYMFYGAKYKLDISNWNLDNVENSEGMFVNSPFDCEECDKSLIGNDYIKHIAEKTNYIYSI